VGNIRSTETTLALATNAGVKQSNQEAFVLGFGKVYYDKDAIANIFGFLDLKKTYRITYDSDQEDAFLVHMQNNILLFQCSPKGLYQMEVSMRYKNDLKESDSTGNLISTVVKNCKGCTI
jgi:hypothetical protein